jgi:Domain of unknown function (DUF4352)
MWENTNATSEKICPSCRGGNAPAALLCQWCGTRLDTQYSPPAPGHAAANAAPLERPRRRLMPVALVLVLACLGLAVTGSLVRSPANGAAGNREGRSGTTDQSSSSGQVVQPVVPTQVGGDPQQPDKTANRVATTGETLETADLLVTLNSVRRNTGGDFFKPKAGYEYIVLDLTYENKGTRDTVVSSLLSANLKDSTGQKYTLALGGTDKSAPDGTIVPGELSRGEISFEVPTTASGLVFTYDPILDGDPVRFSLDK